MTNLSNFLAEPRNRGVVEISDPVLLDEAAGLAALGSLLRPAGDGAYLVRSTIFDGLQSHWLVFFRVDGHPEESQNGLSLVAAPKVGFNLLAVEQLQRQALSELDGGRLERR